MAGFDDTGTPPAGNPGRAAAPNARVRAFIRDLGGADGLRAFIAEHGHRWEARALATPNFSNDSIVQLRAFAEKHRMVEPRPLTPAARQRTDAAKLLDWGGVA